MQEFQQRVINEKRKLDEKMERLSTFLTGEIFKTLPLAEQDRMQRQREYMWQYSLVLGERIAAFRP